MSKKTIKFVEDVPKIRRYLDKRVRAQQKVGRPISAIEFGMRLCQGGYLALHFDVREKHERDGEWTRALDDAALSMQHWSRAYMNAGEYGIEFVLLSGKRKSIAPGENDAAVAAEFGKALLSLVRDAKARGVFAPLLLTEGCQVEILEFDWMWEWPEDEDDLGKRNLFRKLRAERLPAA